MYYKIDILKKVISDDFIRNLTDKGCWFQPVRMKGIDELCLLNSNSLIQTWSSCETFRLSEDIIKT